MFRKSQFKAKKEAVKIALISVSIPEELLEKLREKKISLSKLAQDAAKIELMKFSLGEKDRLKRQLAQEVTAIGKEIEDLTWIREKKIKAIDKMNKKPSAKGK